MTDSKYLPAFGAWLGTLGEDVLSLANLLESTEAPAPFRELSATALASVVRAAELIPEGLEALGYLEQAFLFRVSAGAVLAETPELASEAAPGRVERLAADVPLVAEFLGDDLPALAELAQAGTRRGTPAAALLEDEAARADLCRDARSWVEGYRAPELGAGDEELVKLRSFFKTRLRQAS